MSDYLFMLENHLSTDQNRVVAEVQAEERQVRVVVLPGDAGPGEAVPDRRQRGQAGRSDVSPSNC